MMCVFVWWATAVEDVRVRRRLGWRKEGLTLVLFRLGMIRFGLCRFGLFVDVLWKVRGVIER